MQILNREQTLSPPTCTFLSSSLSSFSFSYSSFMLSLRPSEKNTIPIFTFSPQFSFLSYFLDALPPFSPAPYHSLCFIISVSVPHALTFQNIFLFNPVSTSNLLSIFSISQLQLCCSKARKLYGVGVPFLPYSLISYFHILEPH